LRKALDLYPQDAYSREFLATIYFQQGNLEAALKYWNPEDKPRLRSVAFAPSLQLKESLRNRALAFNGSPNPDGRCTARDSIAAGQTLAFFRIGGSNSIRRSPAITT